MIDQRQPGAEFGSRPAFNAGDKKTQHIVEDLDLILAEALRVMQEKIGHLPKGIDPLLRRAVPYGVFEFGDDGMIERLRHGCWAVCWTLQEFKPDNGHPDLRPR
ncbi:MAG TPA: hypothetical protein VK522_00530 [Pseudolabrys sp.]|nr:hypothetical protein [Pseudolabrys sp.]